MIELEAVKPRSRGRRKLIFALLAVAVSIPVGFHNAGYAILIAGGSAAGEVKNGMVQLNCTYFTGTEKVINHVTRSVKDASRPVRCPWTARIPNMRPPLGEVLTR